MSMISSFFSWNLQEHQRHLRAALEWLQDNGLTVKYKYVFGASAANFLGHHISLSGVCPLPSKVNTVTKFPRPTSVWQLQEFLGMVNYYHLFIPSLAHTMAPLYSTSSKPKSFLWEVLWEEAFITSKKSFASATTLCFLAPDAPLFSSSLHGCQQNLDGHRP